MSRSDIVKIKKKKSRGAGEISMGIEAFKDNIWRMRCFGNSHLILQIKVNAEDVIKKKQT